MWDVIEVIIYLWVIIAFDWNIAQGFIHSKEWKNNDNISFLVIAGILGSTVCSIDIMYKLFMIINRNIGG